MLESMDPIKEVGIYNMHGQLLHTPSGFGSKWEIEIGDIPSAVYLVHVVWNNGREKTLRLVKYQ